MPNTPSLQPWERLIALTLTVSIVAALLFLTLSGAAIDASLALPLRFLLAIAAAALGATLPGAALRLSFAGRGVAIRAAGALGLFLLVWLAGPQMSGTALGDEAQPQAATPELSHASD